MKNIELNCTCGRKAQFFILGGVAIIIVMSLISVILVPKSYYPQSNVYPSFLLENFQDKFLDTLNFSNQETNLFEFTNFSKVVAKEHQINLNSFYVYSNSKEMKKNGTLSVALANFLDMDIEDINIKIEVPGWTISPSEQTIDLSNEQSWDYDFYVSIDPARATGDYPGQILVTSEQTNYDIEIMITKGNRDTYNIAALVDTRMNTTDSSRNSIVQKRIKR